MKAFLSFLFILCIAHTQAQAPVWIAEYNGEGDYSDRYTAIKADAQGNIIVCGSTVTTAQGRNLLLAKYNAAGTKLWSRTFNGPGDGDDEFKALTTDNTGNIYTTGFQKGSGSGNDIITFKISPNGDSLWAQPYISTSFQYDQGNAITLDPSGNVIITGQTDNDPTNITNDDYITIKYNNSGTQQWAKTYNGVGNGVDRPVQVLTDAQSNIFVTGAAENTQNNDYVTIKYNAAGQQLWLQAADRGGTDRAAAMTLDAQGNIYVTGRSKNVADNYDYYTVKYTNAGTVAWTNIYDFVEEDRPNAILTDASGNVFVTGQSDKFATAAISFDIRTIKISNTGALVWAAVYDSPTAKDDIGYTLTTDSGGNLYVTGNIEQGTLTANNQNIVTIKYNPSGQQQWASIFDGGNNTDDNTYAALTLTNGSTYIAGFAGDANNRRNALLLNYNSSGQQQWSKTYNGSGDNSDNIRSIISDASGNVYVAGYTVSTFDDRDFFIAKFNTNGDTVWTRIHNGSSPGSTDEAYQIALGADGNLVAAGFTKNSGTSSDVFVVKYDPNGNLLWQQLYNAPQNESDRAYDMALDNANNIYIAGRTDTDASNGYNYDFLTIKYSPLGQPLWVKTFNGTASKADQIERIAVNPANGDVYVAGESENTTNKDIAVVKYNTAGTQQWAKIFSGTFDDEVTDLLIDATQNIYVAGYQGTSPLTSDYLLLKFNSTGTQLWSKLWDSQFNGLDMLQAITLDTDQNIIGTGTTPQSSGTAHRTTTLKYAAANGNILWTNTPNTTDDNIADAIASLNGNTIVASHRTTPNIANFDIYLNIINTSGTTIGEHWIAPTGTDTIDVPNVLNTNGNTVYIGGSTWRPASQRDMALVKLIPNIPVATHNVYAQAALYPNPTTSHFVATIPTNTHLKTATLYSALGTPIPLPCTLLGSEVRGNLQHLPAGNYWLLLTDTEGKNYYASLCKP